MFGHVPSQKEIARIVTSIAHSVAEGVEKKRRENKCLENSKDTQSEAKQ